MHNFYVYENVFLVLFYLESNVNDYTQIIFKTQ